MAFRFTARAIEGVFGQVRGRGYEEREGSFTIVRWPDGTSRFGAPTCIAWQTDFHPLPDIVNLPYLCLSDRARALIESFEPGVHDFYPVRVLLSDGSEEHRFLLHVTRSFDAVSAVHSNWIKASDVLWEAPPTRERRLVLDARLIGDAHLWVNKGLRSEMQYMASDALAHAAQAMGLTGLLLDHREQTDAEGFYSPPPLSTDRVYVVSEQTRLRPSGYIPLTVKVKLLNGKPEAIRFADDPEASPMPLRTVVTKGRRIEPTDVPTQAYYYQNAKGTAPDIFAYDTLPLTVSARMKALIEAFEPDVHQFLPIAFVDKKGNVSEQRYILVSGALLDAGSREHSTILGDRVWYNPGGEQGTIMIDRAKVAGRHLWLDKYLPGLFVSNEIAAEIEARRFQDLRLGGYDLVG